MSKTFWNNRRVLITGHTGFKGSWLSLWLSHWGAQVCGFALPPPTAPSLFELAGVNQDLTSTIGDIRDLSAVRKTLADHQPEIVFHMAAQPLVRDSYDDPLLTFETNAMGTANLLQAVRDTSSVKAVVVVTTDKVYDNKEWDWGYREAEPLGGKDPYSASKACAELVTASFRHAYFSAPQAPAIATARAGNVIGGGDYAKDRLIVDILKAIAGGHAAEIRNPHAVRPWQHVLEPLAGYILLAQHLCGDHQNNSATASQSVQLADAWNFGPADEDARPVSWICDRMTQLWGDGASWQTVGGDHPHEANYLKLDNSKARHHLQWQPRLKLDQALEWILQWQKVSQTGGDVREETLSQIEQYISLG